MVTPGLVVTLELDESDRQLVLLALAVLSLRSPGFDHALNRIACRVDNVKRERAEMYDAFRLARSDVTPEQIDRKPRTCPGCLVCGWTTAVSATGCVANVGGGGGIGPPMGGTGVGATGSNGQPIGGAGGACWDHRKTGAQLDCPMCGKPGGIGFGGAGGGR